MCACALMQRQRHADARQHAVGGLACRWKKPHLNASSSSSLDVTTPCDSRLATPSGLLLPAEPGRSCSESAPSSAARSSSRRYCAEGDSGGCGLTAPAGPALEGGGGALPRPMVTPEGDLVTCTS